jgi:hypothetical protein
MNYKNREWMTNQIIKLGKTPSSIAKENGWSPTTVLSWYKKLNIEDYKLYNDIGYMIKSYYTENKSALEISRELNVSVITIENAINKLNLSKSQEYKDKATVKLRKNTVSKRYGVSNVMQLDSSKDAAAKTSLERYGKKHFMQTDLGKDRSSKSIYKKNGYKWNVLNPNIKRIVYDKYGVSNVSKLGFVNDKKRKTLINNYGDSSIESNGIVNTIYGLTGRQLSDKYDIPYSSVNFFLRSLKFKSEEDIISFLDSAKKRETYIEKIICKELNIPLFDKKLFSYRPDFKLSERLYLNVDGLYWHSDIFKDNLYHFNLRAKFEENNIQIIQIREDEINFKLPIILSILKNKINNDNVKVFGRNTAYRKVSHSEASLFLKNNHLMGSVKAKHIGLYAEDNLVSVLSYKEYNDKIKIERFCSKINTNVIGGFSKLLSKIPTDKSIHYWADLRYGTGDYLSNLGFVINKETLGWKWTNFRNTYNRLKCRANMDDRKLSQATHAKELGLVKIYDAGQRLWIKEIA